MKFKYLGQSGVKDLDLVLAKIMKPNDILINGRIITIPDSDTQLIKRLQINGNFEVYNEPKRYIKPKKVKEPKKEEKETKEEDK